MCRVQHTRSRPRRDAGSQPNMAQGRAIAPRIDTDTGAYFTELKQHFDQLKAGSEEQELLVGNALAAAAAGEGP